MPILLHAPVERATVFRADQRLRRAHTLGHLRHSKAVLVYRIVKVLTSFFRYAKPVNPLGGIKSEGLQFPTVRTRTGEFCIQTPVRWRFGRRLAAPKQKFRCTRP